MEQELKNLQQEVTLGTMDRLAKWNDDQTRFKKLEENFKILGGLCSQLIETSTNLAKEESLLKERIKKLEELHPISIPKAEAKKSLFAKLFK